MIDNISGLLSYTAGSYRDVLMIPAIESIKKRLCPEPKRTSPQTEWRPVFKVVKTGRQRVDRTYGMSITSNEAYQGSLFFHTYALFSVTYAFSN